MFAKKRIAILTLVLLACAAMLFGACAPTDPPDDSILKELVDTSSEVELLPESDYLAENEYMTINTVLSVTPTNVAVFGQLTEKAISEGIDSVRLSGGVDLVSQEQCVDGYFIIAIDLPGASRTTFAATAIKGEEEIGEPLTFSAPYDATAEGRLDGNSVSVGVRGPVSIHQAVSASPVEIQSMQITKSVNGEPGEKKASDTMGMKHFVRFGLYLVKGSINVQLAEKTGFTEADADVVKECLRTLFVNDASSARPEGSMEVVKMFWWKHNCKDGQYSSAKVHRSVKVFPKNPAGIPACADDYEISVESLPGLEPEVIDGL